MLRLINASAKFPIPYPQVERLDPTIKEPGFVKINGEKIREFHDVFPQRGLQEKTLASDCNLIFLCSSGTMGKTYCGLLKAMQGLGHYGFSARIVTMMSKDGEVGSSMKRDAAEIYKPFANCAFTSSGGVTAEWPQWNNSIKFIHVNYNIENPREWDLYKQHCKANTAGYFYWDEVTGVKEYRKFSYMFSRNRDASKAMKPTTICSFNPEHEHWTTRFLLNAGYIGDDWFLRKDMVGKVTYFYPNGDDVDDIVFGQTREEVVRKARVTVTEQEDEELGMTPEMLVKSFTVFSGTAADNKILVHRTGGESIANLAAVGSTESLKMKDGYFGPTDNNDITVSAKMIDNFFDSPNSPVSGEQMWATLDVSSGGEDCDNAPLWIWRGSTAIALEFYSGKIRGLEPWATEMMSRYKIPRTNLVFDSVGIGYYLQGYTDGIPVIGNSRPVQEYDQAGNPVAIGSWFNLRSQLMGKIKVLLELGEISCAIDKNMLVPHGPQKVLKPLVDVLKEERMMFILEKKNYKDYYQNKKEFKSKYKLSPDIFDSLILVAMVFLSRKERKTAEPEFTAADYAGLYN